ncbi:disease resistance protein RUN1-like isoform X2 [Rosa chinensis]|uniref:disease resistance protein RUN1-like isoform X2 n=1 Tax=Rosa chinensis TaxID=74649 RepID=UPI001AD9230A|nr:disease resistance protein RUN1-like isoform X2 [Rosa chinensis]
MADVRAAHHKTSSSNTASPFPSRYHVFLSFRGQDTRKTFTDHLYTAFKDQGFRTFLDDDELERGEDINPGLEKAIQQSRSSVIVFSKDYASSRWCLNELLMILERKRTSDHVVLPVFYNVEPSQVRKQTGSFGEAFARHQKTQSLDKVKEWKDALTKVADLGGMVLQNQDDGYESKFIKTIVKEIGDKLSRTPLSVGFNLIGIHSRAYEINQWIQDGSNGIGIHVIFGMSGIGKTTVAKHVYNANFRRFEGSSFIENIRETSEQTNGLVKIQKQLLNDILNGREVKLRNASEGKIKIEDAISCKRVLLVLDDVDHMDQFDAVLAMQDRFYPGSKIIITTSRATLLKAQGVSGVHYVQALDDSESLKLFSWHAFRQDHPIEGYMEHTKKFVRHSGGLPLALQVLGSSLFRENIDVWESALRKLEAIPNSEIMHKLRISYDAVDKHDQEVFLHIACFFIGNDKDYTVGILDECDLHTTIGIINLIDRCLVAIDGNNKVVMHDVVRDMGRGIVRLAAEEPRKRSRLWHHKDSMRVLREKNGTKRIEGFELNLQRHLGVTTPSTIPNNFVVETSAFARMHKLKLLRLSHVHLTGCYEEFPTELRMLCWIAFPLDSIPINFHLENLVVLEMQYSSLRQILNGTKCFPSMKILDLSHSHDLIAAVDFSLCLNLEKLILLECEGLIDVHESIGKLGRLVYLNMKDCKSLRRLPKTIGTLKRLDTLILSGCLNLNNSSIEMIRGMESLKVLELDRIPISQLFTLCGEVKLESYLPFSLLSLSLKGCNLSDDSFPVDFGSLSLLRSLDLSDNPICGLPNCVKGLTMLDELSFSNCLSLKSLLGLPKVNFMLSLGDCKALVKITYQSRFGTPYQWDKNHSLVDWEYKYKLEPIGRVDVEILNLLGLRNLDFEIMPTIRICKPFQGYEIFHHGGIQGLHEYDCTNSYFKGNARKIDMFSTFLPGNVVPGHFTHKSKEPSSISFIVPLPSLPGLRIRGFNIFIVYAISDDVDDKNYYWPSNERDKGAVSIKVENESNDDNWDYSPVFHAIPGKGEDMTWLSHWNMKNQVKGGDQMAVSFQVQFSTFLFLVKEWGIQVVQEKQEDKTYTDLNSTTNANCNPCATGGDMSSSDEPLPGPYLLSYEPHAVEADNCNPCGTDGDMSSSDEPLPGPYLLSYEPHTVEADKDKKGDEEEAEGDLFPASAMRTGSNSRERGFRKWKVLIIAAVILAAAISAAHHFEDPDLDTNLSKTVTNPEEDEDQTLGAAASTDGSNNGTQGLRMRKMLIIAAVFFILSLSVHWLFSFSGRERSMSSILVPT